MSLSFWTAAIVITMWLVLSVLKFCIKSTAEEHRVQLLQELGPSALNIRRPQFLGFFHPYWYVSQLFEMHNTFLIIDYSLVMQVEEVSVYFGQLFAMSKEISQTLFVQYILAMSKQPKNKSFTKSR